jgi:hypothetical protein
VSGPVFLDAERAGKELLEDGSNSFAGVMTRVTEILPVKVGRKPDGRGPHGATMSFESAF